VGAAEARSEASTARAPTVDDDDVVLLEQPTSTPVVLLEQPKKRRHSQTEVGLGAVGGTSRQHEAVDAGVPNNASQAEQAAPERASSVDMQTGPFQRTSLMSTVDDGWGEPGSTIPPAYLGALPDALEPASPLGIPVPDVKDEDRPWVLDTDPVQGAAYDASVRRLAATLDVLDKAQDRDAIIDRLIEHMGATCDRAAFFAVKRGSLSRWKAAGRGVAGAGSSSDPALDLALDQPSTFRDIVATGMPFRGAVDDPIARRFLIDTVGSPPQDMIALPVCVRGKAVGILYGDERRLPVFDEHLTTLARNAGAALERVVIRRRTTAPGQ
jgi:hypothetical protein